MTRSHLIAGALTLSLMPGSALASVLYLNDGDGRTIYAVETTTRTVIDTISYAGNDRSFPIAVSGDIRTTGYTNTEVGSRFDLDGNLLSTSYTHGVGETLADGATDGTSNFGISWEAGNVYRFDRSWGDSSFLFNADGAGSIAYNPADGTFWTGRDRTNNPSTGFDINQYSITGVFLSGFDTPEIDTMDWHLSLDPSDGTLWMNAFQSTNLLQYSQSGVLLSSGSVAGLGSATSFFSGEFAVPEPSTSLLAGLSAFALLARRRRRNG